MSRYYDNTHLNNVEFRKPFRVADEASDDYALWWGPSKKKREAEAFTEVMLHGDDTFEVSEYSYLGGYEAYVEGEIEWSKQTVTFTIDDLHAWYRLNDERFRGNALNAAASLGVGLIGYYGGEEEDLTSEELP